MNRLFLDFDCTIADSIKTYCKVYNERYTFIKNVIMISGDVKTEGIKMDKSSVNMCNSIFIDDHEDNLLSSNAKTKICFGKEYDWNKNWTGERCLNWREVEKLLL